MSDSVAIMTTSTASSGGAAPGSSETVVALDGAKVAQRAASVFSNVLAATTRAASAAGRRLTRRRDLLANSRRRLQSRGDQASSSSASSDDDSVDPLLTSVVRYQVGPLTDTVLAASKDMATIALSSMVAGVDSLVLQTGYLQGVVFRDTLQGLAGRGTTPGIITMPVVPASTSALYAPGKPVRVAFPSADHLVNAITHGGNGSVLLPGVLASATVVDVVLFTWASPLHPFDVPPLEGGKYARVEVPLSVTTSVSIRQQGGSSDLNLLFDSQNPVYLIVPPQASIALQGTELGQQLGVGAMQVIAQRTGAATGEPGKFDVAQCIGEQSKRVVRATTTDASATGATSTTGTSTGRTWRMCPRCHTYSEANQTWTVPDPGRAGYDANLTVHKVQDGYVFCKSLHLSDFIVSFRETPASAVNRIKDTPQTSCEKIEEKRLEYFNQYISLGAAIAAGCGLPRPPSTFRV